MDALTVINKEPEGPEWCSIAAYMERYGFSRIQARARLERLVADGKAERWVGVAKGNKRVTAKYRALLP